MKPNQRIDEIDHAVVSEQNVVAVFSDIRHRNDTIAEQNVRDSSRSRGGFQCAHLIARAAIWISATLSLQRRRKQSETAAIRNRLIAAGRALV